MGRTKSEKTIIIAGGGTGGHLYPGLALAEKIKSFEPSLRLVFVGSKHGLDARLLPGKKYDFHALPIGRGSPLSFRQPLNLFKFFYALPLAYALFVRLRPCAVISLGGFAAFVPGIIAAWLRLPLFLLEQNALPGRVTRALSYFSTANYLQFFAASSYLKGKGKMFASGSPVRAELISNSEGEAESKNRLLVMGGSQGALRLNQLLVAIVKPLLQKGIAITHLTGERDFPWVKDKVAGFSGDYQVFPYREDMAVVFAETGLVVSRAGASVLAELSCQGIPALLVPYPAAKDDHQSVNAKVYVEVGAAKMLSETSLTEELFLAEILQCWEKKAELEKMSVAMASLAQPDAATIIAEDVLQQIDMVEVGRKGETCV